MDTDERPRDVRLVGNHVEVFFPEDWVVYEADVRRLFARAPRRVTETTPIPGIGARWIAEFDNRSEAADALDRLLSGDTTEEAPPAQTLGAASHPRASESSRRDRLRRRLLIVVVVALLTMFAWFVCANALCSTRDSWPLQPLHGREVLRVSELLVTRCVYPRLLLAAAA